MISGENYTQVRRTHAKSWLLSFVRPKTLEQIYSEMRPGPERIMVAEVYQQNTGKPMPQIEADRKEWEARRKAELKGGKPNLPRN